MSTIKASSLAIPSTPSASAAGKPPVAVATTELPQGEAATLSQGEHTQTNSRTAQNSSLQAAHENVQQKLGDPPALSKDELQRLLKTPTQRRQLSRVLQQAPELKQAFLKHSGGAEVLSLLQQRILTPDQTKTVQRFLAQHTQTPLAYSGHNTGIDGQYGQRTHDALVELLTEALAQPTAPPPATTAPATVPAATPSPIEKPVFQGPGQMLNTLSSEAREQLQQKHPEVYRLLLEPHQSPANTRLLQQAITDAGYSLKYPGHATGVDGDFGARSQAALRQLIQESQANQAPATPAPTPTTAPVSKPEQPVTPPEQPVVTAPPLKSSDSLPQLAAQIQKMPEETRAKLPAPLQNALSQIAGGDSSKATATALQQALVDMGQKLNYPGHATGVDGQPGQRTRQALINVVEAAQTGQTAAVQKSGPFPLYDRILDDNLLDMTMAIGYDEGTDKYASAHIFEERKMMNELADKGFVRDDAKARALLKAAGQDIKADYTAFYVKENISEKDGKPVHALVRVIHAGDGTQGAQKRAAAIEAMNQSDVFMYGGHARYGTGIDFDRNFTVTIDWQGVANAPDTGKVTYKDYGALKDLLGGNEKAKQWLTTLQAQGKIEIEGNNDGNIRMSEKDLHRGEFGSRLMNQALDGVKNTLSEEIQGDRYRLWLFNGCRTADYMPSIEAEGRENKALQSKSLDVVTTEQTLYWHNISRSLMNFLDGVMAQDGTPDLLQRMEQANPEQADRATHSVHGFADNPKQ